MRPGVAACVGICVAEPEVAAPVALSGAPHVVQNRADSGTSCPHCAQKGMARQSSASRDVRPAARPGFRGRCLQSNFRELVPGEPCVTAAAN